MRGESCPHTAPIMRRSGSPAASGSDLILHQYRRKYFKHAACHCPQCGAALKGCIDASCIVVVNRNDLSAKRVIAKSFITENPEMRKVRVALTEQVHKWAFFAIAVLIDKPVAIIVDSVFANFMSLWFYIRIGIIAILRFGAFYANTKPVAIIINTAGRYGCGG
jgi:hypothetical protein